MASFCLQQLRGVQNVEMISRGVSKEAEGKFKVQSHQDHFPRDRRLKEDNRLRYLSTAEGPACEDDWIVEAPNDSVYINAALGTQL